MPDALMTPKQFAQHVGHSIGFIMKLIHAGEIEVHDLRAPGATMPRYMINPGEREAWLRKRRTRLAPAESNARGRQQRKHRRPTQPVAEVIR